MAYLLIFLTVFLWGLAPIFDKFALKESSPFSGLIIRTLAVAGGLLFLYPFFLKYKAIKFTASSVFLFVLSGFCAGLLGMITYYSALKRLPASVVVPLCSTYPLIAAILGAFILKEELTFLRLIGIILIILGVWLVK